jgi:hypothetical protein
MVKQLLLQFLPLIGIASNLSEQIVDMTVDIAHEYTSRDTRMMSW